MDVAYFKVLFHDSPGGTGTK